MLYTAQNSLSYADYYDVSDSWGINIADPYCTDNYTNCLNMAANCCQNDSVLTSDCCATCKVIDSTATCISQYGTPANGYSFVYSDDW